MNLKQDPSRNIYETPLDNERTRLFIQATLFSVLWTSISLLAIGSILFFLLPHDPGPISPDLLAKVAALPTDFWPKPSERFSFIFLVFTTPLLIVFWIRFYRRNTLRIRPDFLVIFSGLTLVFFGCAIIKNDLISMVFRSDFLGDFLLEYVWIIENIILGFFMLHLNISQKMVSQRTSKWLPAFIVLWSIYFCLSWRIFGVSSVKHFAHFTIHLNAVFYSVVQATAGKLPLIDFLPQYGWYGNFVAPWFKTVGLRVATFTATFSFLQWVALMAIFISSKNWIQNKFLKACLFFTLITATANWAPLWTTHDPYFQYWPVRFFCPAVGLYLFNAFLTSRRLSQSILLSCFCGVALLWNLDSGFALFGAWLGYLLYDLLSNASIDFTTFKRSALQGSFWKRNWIHLVLALFLPLAVMSCILLSIYSSILLKGEASIDFSLLTRYHSVFYGAGFYMLPLPLRPHPWQVAILIHITCLTVAILGSSMKLRRRVFDFLIFLGILGIGLFTYYEGRSHDLVLSAVIWPSVLGFFILSDQAYSLSLRSTLRTTPLERSFLILLLIPTHLLGVLSFLSQLRGLPTYFSIGYSHFVEDPRALTEPMQTRVKGSIASVIHEIQKNYLDQAVRNNFVILSGHQSVFYAETGTHSLIRGPSFAEMVLRQDWDSWFDQLEELSPNYFFVDEDYVRKCFLSKDQKLFSRLEKVLTKYQQVDRIGFFKIFAHRRRS